MGFSQIAVITEMNLSNPLFKLFRILVINESTLRGFRPINACKTCSRSKIIPLIEQRPSAKYGFERVALSNSGASV